MMGASQTGASLLVMLMVAHGASKDVSAQHEAAKQNHARAVLVAAADTPGNAGDTGGAFLRLSPDEKKMARSVLEAEQVGPETGPAWSLDRIAAARAGGADWAAIVADMQARHLIASNTKLARAGSPHDRSDSERLAGDLAIAAGPAVKAHGKSARHSGVAVEQLASAGEAKTDSCNVGKAVSAADLKATARAESK